MAQPQYSTARRASLRVLPHLATPSTPLVPGAAGPLLRGVLSLVLEIGGMHASAVESDVYHS